MGIVFNKWTVGFFVAFLIVWFLSAVFCNSIMPVSYDAVLHEYVANAGVIRWRSEGWANTVYGENGLLASESPLARNGQAQFMLWGDSQVEALGVPDSKKATVVLRQLSDQRYVVIANGKSGRKVADYYFQLPYYEEAFPSIKGHLFVLSGMEDVLPTRSEERGSQFSSSPWSFHEGAFTPSPIKAQYGDTIHAMHLGEVLRIGKKVLKQELRFMPSIIHINEERKEDNRRPKDLDRGWTFMLKALKSRANGELAFVYCPFLPRLENGTVVFDDQESELSRRFQEICERHGIAFIDLTQDFRLFYETTGRLPRGFINSPPGSGHLNADGQMLLAKALLKYFERYFPATSR